jgi:hypothetical protein
MQLRELQFLAWLSSNLSKLGDGYQLARTIASREMGFQPALLPRGEPDRHEGRG